MTGFYFYTGQALHEGPIKSEAASHGCIRANGRVIAALEGYIKQWAPFMVYSKNVNPEAHADSPSRAHGGPANELPGWRDDIQGKQKGVPAQPGQTGRGDRFDPHRGNPSLN